MYLADLSLIAAAEAVRSRRVSSADLVESCLQRIADLDHLVGSFARIDENGARLAAQRCDDGEPRGPLHGVPIALKDLIYTKGIPTTANCCALVDFVPDADATVVRRLKRAGAIILGKANTHELAFGVSCPESHNPWDLTKMTGGSSGGNAAALAARQVFGGIGSDTGGSIRIPSSYCGTTGLKTTRGAVPSDGVHLLSDTYDTLGPMARSAEDCAILFEVIADVALLGEVRLPSTLRLGVPTDSFHENTGIDSEVGAALDTAVGLLTPLVAQVQSVEVPNHVDHGEPGSQIVFAEAANRLFELTRAHSHQIGDEIRANLAVGQATTPTQLAAARLLRTGFELRYDHIFDNEGIDVLIAPVTPNRVLAHGIESIHGVPLIPATTQYTFPVNGAGLPAVALPCDTDAQGLPIGFQLIGRRGSDRTLLAFGKAFQSVTDFHAQVPRLVTAQPYIGG